MNFPQQSIEKIMIKHLVLQNSYHIIVDKQISEDNSIKIVNEYNKLCHSIKIGAAKLIYEDILLYKNNNYSEDFINFMRRNAIIISILTYLSHSKKDQNQLIYAKELMEEFNISLNTIRNYL